MTSEQPEIVDEETGLVTVQRDALTEFGRDEIGLDRARGIANRLDAIIREKELFVNMGRKDHLLVEAWTCCASMVGVAPKTEWTREIRNPVSGEFEGNKARVEVIQISTGQSIGAAEASCFANEVQKKRDGTYLHRWVDDCPRYAAHPTAPCKIPPTRHAIESMAQTRATSKAIGQILRWIPVLAGYSGTPAEEMPANPQVWSPDGGGEEFTPRRPSRQDAQGTPAPAGTWPVGKHRGKKPEDIDTDDLRWAAESHPNEKAKAMAKTELKRRGTGDESPDKPPTDAEWKALIDSSYKRARVLIDEVSLACGPLKHDTEDALAASIRKWALVHLALERDRVKASHLEPLRRAIEAANINADGETFIPAEEGEL